MASCTRLAGRHNKYQARVGFTTQRALPRHYGPIQLQPIQLMNGKGRGLVLTQEVTNPGQLLLISKPVAVVHGTTCPQELKEFMLDSQLTQSESLLLSLSHGWAPYPTPANTVWTPPDTTPNLAELKARLDLLDTAQQSQELGGSSNLDGMHLDDQDDERQDRLGRVLELNCFSEEDMDVGYLLGQLIVQEQQQMHSSKHENEIQGTGNHPPAQQAHGAPDQLSAYSFLALAAAGGDQQHRALPAHVGLWTEHAWMNHSCAPNVVNYVLGSCMVVRAGRVPLALGTEVQDTYLGADLAQPLSVRRELLQDNYGFSCCCDRCRLDAQVQGAAPEVEVLLLSLASRQRTVWEPRVRRLLEQPNTELQSSSSRQWRWVPRQGWAPRRQACCSGHLGRRSVRRTRVDAGHRLQLCKGWEPRLSYAALRALQRDIDRCVKRAEQLVHSALASLKQLGQEVLHAWPQATGEDGAAQGTLDTAADVVLFSIYGSYELLSLCLQRMAQQAAGAPSRRAAACQAAKAAYLAAARCASMARVVVPGSRLHVEAELSAWVAAASWAQHQDQGLPQSMLSKAQGDLGLALTLRYGPLTRSDKMEDELFGRLVAFWLGDTLVEA